VNRNKLNFIFTSFSSKLRHIIRHHIY